MPGCLMNHPQNIYILEESEIKVPLDSKKLQDGPETCTDSVWYANLILFHNKKQSSVGIPWQKYSK